MEAKQFQKESKFLDITTEALIEFEINIVLVIMKPLNLLIFLPVLAMGLLEKVSVVAGN